MLLPSWARRTENEHVIDKTMKFVTWSSPFAVAFAISVVAMFWLPLLPSAWFREDRTFDVSFEPGFDAEVAKAIVLAARGGDWVSLRDVRADVVNEPYTYLIKWPTAWDLEFGSDDPWNAVNLDECKGATVKVGHSAFAESTAASESNVSDHADESRPNMLAPSGYRFAQYLRETEDGWRWLARSISSSIETVWLD
ncbi:MAG: hypothetical protein AAFX44_06390 [Pseudomonadota bacterium]